MSTNNTGAHNMGGFITALYGAILGVNLSKVNFTWDVLWQLHSNTGIELRFQFFMLTFSLVIVAHDWYTYHREGWSTGRGFGAYVFQLGFLLCLTMMLVFCSYATLKEWYIAAVGYAVFNIVERLRIDLKVHHRSIKEMPRRAYIKYITHPLLFLAAIIFLPWKMDSSQYLLWTIVFSTTVLLVIFFWWFADRQELTRPVGEVKDRLNIQMAGMPVTLEYTMDKIRLNAFEQLKVWQLLQIQQTPEQVVQHYEQTLHQPVPADKLHSLQQTLTQYQTILDKAVTKEVSQLEQQLIQQLNR